jgi:hypothetical protein
MSCRVIFLLIVVVTGNKPLTLTTKTPIYVRPTTSTYSVSVGDAQRTRRSTVAPSEDASLLFYIFSVLMNCPQSSESFCLSLCEEGIWFCVVLVADNFCAAVPSG